MYRVGGDLSFMALVLLLLVTPVQVRDLSCIRGSLQAFPGFVSLTRCVLVPV